MIDSKLFTPPGYAIPCDQDTYLRVSTMDESDASALNLMVRFMYPDGTLRQMQFVHTLTNDRALTETTFRMTDGWIVSVGVALADGSVVRGECFATVALQHGAQYSNQPYQILISDYVYKSLNLGYPGSLIRSSLEGGGLFTYFVPANPLAGDDAEYTILANTRIRIIGMQVSLNTDANAGNRYMGIIGKRGAVELFRMVSGTAHPASTTVVYNFNVSWGYEGIGSDYGTLSFPPDLVLLAGDTIETRVIDIAAGDQVDVVSIYAEQWLED